MNLTPRYHLHALCGAALLVSMAQAQEAVPSARDLAAQLSTLLQDGSSLVRLKMNISPPGGGSKTVLQIQVKSRRTKGATDLVYQVLWPKDRKGCSFLVHKAAGRAPSASSFTPPDSLVTLTGAKLKEGVFGGDLSYDDLAEDFFAWGNQAITGSELVGRVPCQILESKPAGADASNYGKVRSWIDTKRMVTMRVEKYTAGGKLAKRIDTTDVSKDDTGRSLGSGFRLQRAGLDGVTEIEGSNSKHGVTFSATDFTPEGLRTLK